MDKMAWALLLWLQVPLIGFLKILSLSSTGMLCMSATSAEGWKELLEKTKFLMKFESLAK